VTFITLDILKDTYSYEAVLLGPESGQPGPLRIPKEAGAM